jgi:hypothetical protein
MAPAEPAAPPAPAQTSEAQTVSDEEQAIKAQIESFVSQNSQTAPGAAAESAPTTDAPTEQKKDEAPAATGGSDAVMADAIKDLVSSTAEGTPAPTVDGTTTMPAPDVVSPSASAPAEGTAAPAPDVAPAAASDDEDDSSTVSHKKIIKPISEPQAAPAPDLNELLAKEGIVDGLDDDGGHPYAPPSPPQPGAASNAPHPPGHVISPNSGQGGVDPNSIAL